MDTFHELVHRYANACGHRVDDREWLMLLELDPVAAAQVLAHLAVLAAEDTLVARLARARQILSDAASGDTCRTELDTARSHLDTLTTRFTTARDRAQQVWTAQVLPLLRRAGVVTDQSTNDAEPAQRQGRWQDTQVRLPGMNHTYPAQIVTGGTGRPAVRFDRATCRRILDDLTATHTLTRTAWRHLTPTVVIANDEVRHTHDGSLDDAWRAGATVVAADPEGMFGLGSGTWPWEAAPRLDHTPRRRGTAVRRLPIRHSRTGRDRAGIA